MRNVTSFPAWTALLAAVACLSACATPAEEASSASVDGGTQHDATKDGAPTSADAGKEGASVDGGSDPLAFPKEDFTTVTTSVATSSGTASVTYHFYQGITYCADPVDKTYESMNISVPVSIDGAAVDASDAPILLDVNVGGYAASADTTGGSGPPTGGGPGGPPGGGDGGRIPVGLGDASGGAESGTSGTSGVSNSALFLAAGYVVVDPGCRGHDNVTDAGVYYGKAPAAVVDLKAAIRYLRHNAGVLPGNMNRIWASGGSAGAALSTVLGASGNSPLYDSYLSAIGAASTTDDIYGVAAYSPMTNMDHEDVLYEAEFGSTSYQGSLVNQTISQELQAAFVDYQNGLALTGDDSYGTLTADNLTDYVMKMYLVPAASKYIAALSTTAQTSYLSSRAWITWDSSTSTASFTFGDYVSYTGRGKGVPAFDSFFDSTAYAGTNTSLTPEAEELGSPTTNARHFTNYSLQKTTGDAGATISSDLL